jgi:hypothetical protein
MKEQENNQQISAQRPVRLFLKALLGVSGFTLIVVTIIFPEWFDSLLGIPYGLGNGVMGIVGIGLYWIACMIKLHPLGDAVRKAVGKFRGVSRL